MRQRQIQFEQSATGQGLQVEMDAGMASGADKLEMNGELGGLCFQCKEDRATVAFEPCAHFALCQRCACTGQYAAEQPWPDPVLVWVERRRDDGIVERLRVPDEYAPEQPPRCLKCMMFAKSLEDCTEVYAEQQGQA